MREPFGDPSSEVTLPPLRIHHFMLWTAAVAVVMALYGKMGLADSKWSTTYYLHWKVLSAIPATIALTTLCFGIYWKWRGHEFFDEVGHWLLITLAIGLFKELLMEVVDLWARNRTGHWNPSWLFYSKLGFLFAVNFVTALLLAIVARRVAGTANWKRFCYSGAFVYLLQTFYCCYDILRSMLLINIGPTFDSTWSYFLLLPWLAWLLTGVWAIREDRIHQFSRHWSHWCGGLTWFFTTLGGILFSVYLFVASNS